MSDYAPIQITMPKTLLFEAEVMSPDAEPGDICNKYGDIRGNDTETTHSIIRSGIVWVTTDQAKVAVSHGWELRKEYAEGVVLVQVMRG